MDSGRIGYKALDGRFQGSATNCIHAVTGAIPKWGGFGVSNRMYGMSSARFVAERVTASHQALAQNQDWVLDRLGIRTGTSIRYMAYNPARNQHLARVLQESGTVVVREPAGNIGQ